MVLIQVLIFQTSWRFRNRTSSRKVLASHTVFDVVLSKKVRTVTDKIDPRGLAGLANIDT